MSEKITPDFSTEAAQDDFYKLPPEKRQEFIDAQRPYAEMHNKRFEKIKPEFDALMLQEQMYRLAGNEEKADEARAGRKKMLEGNQGFDEHRLRQCLNAIAEVLPSLTKFPNLDIKVPGFNERELKIVADFYGRDIKEIHLITSRGSGDGFIGVELGQIGHNKILLSSRGSVLLLAPEEYKETEII